MKIYFLFIIFLFFLWFDRGRSSDRCYFGLREEVYCDPGTTDLHLQVLLANKRMAKYAKKFAAAGAHCFEAVLAAEMHDLEEIVHTARAPAAACYCDPRLPENPYCEVIIKFFYFHKTIVINFSKT